MTKDDVLKALEDERHLGYGLAEIFDLPQRKQDLVFNAVARQATALGLSYNELFHWVNSKYGRWLYDHLYGNLGTSNITGASVKEALESYYMTRQVVDEMYRQSVGLA